MSVVEIIATVFLVAGAFTMFVGAVGVVRFPDFYSRLHAAGKGDTMGQGLVLAGLIVITAFGGSGNDVFRIILIAFFVFILNATATHALARAGWLAGLKPYTDKLGEGPAKAFEQREGQMTDADRESYFQPGSLEAAESDDEEGEEADG
jgi:multicomponent Na+:H+ antiporter subunit G